MAISTTSWVGQPHIKGSTESMRMFMLTASIIGLQFAWGTELTYCTPYLLSLGMSKSRMSLVWTAGPLSGLIVQPLIGMMSDKSRSKYGRRRPFMLAGTAAVGVCYLVLGWAKEIAAWFVDDAEGRRKLAIVLAVTDIYVLDFVINVAQSTCKALIVDTLPIEKQQLGAAWVSRMGGIGHLLVYAIGALDLNTIFGNFLGDTQFKKVCVIAAIAMGIAQSTTAWAVQERVLVADSAKGEDDKQSIVAILSQTLSTILYVPERIQAICWVQFWSWIGWFPVLFYGSTWVGEIYLRYEVDTNHSTNDALNEVGRHGSMSLIVFSIVATICSIVLPWFIQSPDDNDRPSYTARPPASLSPVLDRVKFRKPTLLTAWAAGCLLFAAAMIWAPIVKSVWFATLLVALLGVSNSIATLSPATFLGVEINRLSSGLPVSHSRVSSGRRSDSIELDGMTDSPPRSILHLRHDSNGSMPSSSTGELSGIYLGILNIYTTLPQFVGTAISWVVFTILEPGKSPELAKDAHPDEHHSAEGSFTSFEFHRRPLLASYPSRPYHNNDRYHIDMLPVPQTNRPRSSSVPDYLRKRREDETEDDLSMQARTEDEISMLFQMEEDSGTQDELSAEDESSDESSVGIYSGAEKTAGVRPDSAAATTDEMQNVPEDDKSAVNGVGKERADPKHYDADEVQVVRIDDDDDYAGAGRTKQRQRMLWPER